MKNLIFNLRFLYIKILLLLSKDLNCACAFRKSYLYKYTLQYLLLSEKGFNSIIHFFTCNPVTFFGWCYCHLFESCFENLFDLMLIVVKEAKEIKCDVQYRTKWHHWSLQDFLEAVQKCNKSVSKEDLEKYEKWMEEFGSS